MTACPERIGDWFDLRDTALPVLPAIATRVIELASDPDVHLGRLAALMSKDQVLASRLLGLANSAYCAPLQPISTVAEAIVRMGTNAVRNLAITVSFTSRMQDPDVYGDEGPRLSDHALGSAYLARLVAEQAGEPEDEAFLYGLLHDVGKLVLLKQARRYSRRCGRPVDREELQRATAEWHAAIGARALRSWGLPEDLDEPVEHHHSPNGAGDHRRAAVAYVADRLSHRYGFGCEPEPAELLDDPWVQALGITADWLGTTDARAPGLFAVAKEALS
jgi:putative nucleotidyltransferase with HDIG domain